MTKTAQVAGEAQGFWSGEYRGRAVAAAFLKGRGWVVYLDKVLQPHALFDSFNDATNWLERRVDGRGASRMFGAGA